MREAGRGGGRGEGGEGSSALRWIAIGALLALGGLAFARLPADFLPRRSFPELSVDLQLAESGDPAQVTRDAVVPIESALRAAGGLRALGGEVRANGAHLTARFAPGTDIDRKTARVESELGALGRRLPAGSLLSVTAAAAPEGDLLALVWLAGVRDDAAAEEAAEAVREVPGVRDAALFGAGHEELRVEMRSAALDPWAGVRQVREEIDRSWRVSLLGRARQGARLLPVVVPPSTDRLERLPVGAVLLGELATIRRGRAAPQAIVRYRGEPARALFVWRSPGAPLLATDRALRHRLGRPGGLPERVRGIVGWGEAGPLRDLLLRLGGAALLASLAAALLGYRLAGSQGAASLGLAIPAAAAAAANAFWLTGVELNVTTFVALALAAGAVLPAAALRLARRGGSLPYLATALAAAATLPLLVSLGGADLVPLLAEPARALLLGLAASLAAAALLPLATKKNVGVHRFPGPAAPGQRRAALLLRQALRDPGTVVLGTATAACLALMLLGQTLIPKSSDLSPDHDDLRITLRLPEGTSLAETERRMRQVEERLASAEEVTSFWTRVQAGDGLTVAEVRPRDRRPDRLFRLSTRLRYELAAVGALRIEAREAGRGSTFAALLEDEPRADEDGTFYRVLLRGADLAAVRAGYDRLLQRLESQKVRPHWITGTEEPAVRTVLHPASWTAPEEAAELASLLRQASSPPTSRPIPGNPGNGGRRWLTVVPAGTPVDPDPRAPRMADLLGRPLLLAGGKTVTPAAALTAADESDLARVPRQGGRFVLPVEIRIPLDSRDARIDLRRRIDESLAQLKLPAGCDLERPPLSPLLWQPDRLRALALAFAVPLLLGAVAAVRTRSPWKALAALAPLAAGLLAALPRVWQAMGQADELTLFALAAALALVLPAALEALPAALEALPAAASGSGGATLYLTARRRGPWLLGAAATLALGLFAATAGTDPTRARWAVPLQAAALAGGVALAASALLAPAFLLAIETAARRWQARGREEARRRRHPPVWREEGRPVLAVRQLTRIYGRQFRALSSVSFELSPGIVGLLGPNGAGKTTLLRILTGLLEPTRGAVLFRGVPVTAENLPDYRRRVGFLPQDFNAYPGFTAEQFLEHWALERGMDDPRRRRQEIDALLAAVGLAEHAGRKVRDFSGGMRQRVGIARALLGAPPILIVDEPTTGLDIEARARFRRILLETAGERIVIFSTHIASDVEAAARRILLLHRGVLRFDGSPEELVARARGRVFQAVLGDADVAELGRHHRITARVRVLEGIQVRAVVRSNERPGEPLPGEAVEPDLEEAYLAEIALAESGQ